MNNKTNTPASYGEPWRDSAANTGNLPFIETAQGNAIAQGYWASASEQGVARAIACVNTCQGIADPVEALKMVREALQKTIAREYYFINDVDEPACKETQEFVGMIASALAKLNNTAP